jgi:hypothetical protein
MVHHIFSVDDQWIYSPAVSPLEKKAPISTMASPAQDNQGSLGVLVEGGEFEELAAAGRL